MERMGLILFAVFLIGLIGLDVALVVSLARRGDERRQMMVWKAGTYTLLGTVGSLILQTVECLVKMERVAINPFTQLAATATIYFLCLAYYKRKYGG